MLGSIERIGPFPVEFMSGRVAAEDLCRTTVREKNLVAAGARWYSMLPILAGQNGNPGSRLKRVMAGGEIRALCPHRSRARQDPECVHMMLATYARTFAGTISARIAVRGRRVLAARVNQRSHGRLTLPVVA